MVIVVNVQKLLQVAMAVAMQALISMLRVARVQCAVDL